MLDVEYAQSSNPDDISAYENQADNRHFLIEVRPVSGSRAHAKVQGHSRTSSATRTQAQVRLFAMSDPAASAAGGNAHMSVIEHLADGFRSAADHEPVGVTLGRLIRVLKENTTEQTAVVACALCFDRVVVAHIGSARCYLIRHNHATRLTARDVEVTDHQIMPGDMLLLCCEGLPQTVKGSEMATVTGKAASLRAAIRTLVDLAKERSATGTMNILLVRVRAVERSISPRTHASAHR